MHFTFEGGHMPCPGRLPEPKQLIMSFLRRTCSLPKQVVLTMQATAILLFAVCIQVSAAGYSQTVSFTGKDVPLKTVFAAVKKQTGYGVFYTSGEVKTLEGATNVTLDVKNIDLNTFLQLCLRYQSLTYKIEGSTIFIQKKEFQPALQSDESQYDPTSEIKGHVTNNKGEPLNNANVIIKRTGRGTITDASGNFVLSGVNSEDILQISYIGYRMQSIPIKNRSNLIIILEVTTSDLDQVVVQAYGTTSQRLATGNIGTVSAEQIARQPVMNPLEALQGQVAGVVVTQTSGYASGGVNIEVRGRSTISPSFPSDPLYVVDGVPITILDVSNTATYATGSQGVLTSGFSGPANGQSPFFSINPQDIESISILKDADATAIYGSRGANGVVIITTKKGKAGKTHFDIGIYSGISKASRTYKFLNTQQYVSMRKEALANDGLPIDINTAPDMVSWDTTRYTDWQNYAWGGLGKITDVQTSLSGGDARTTFRIGAGYRRQTDIITASGANQRSSVSFNISHKTLNQRLTFSLSGEYSIGSINTVFTPNVTSLPPNAPAVFDSKGNLNYLAWAPLDNNFPFSNLKQSYISKTNFLNSSATISYDILNGLTAKIDAGYNNFLTNQDQAIPKSSLNPINNIPTGSLLEGINTSHNFIFEPQIEFNGFIKKGKINILIGSSQQINATQGLFVQGYNYSNDALIRNINSAPDKFIQENGAEFKYAAIFSRINYNWENKYIININARRDGSSRFGPGRQFGNFGSIGLAWIFSEEKWAKKSMPFLSFGKLRGSYGTTGNDFISDYQFQSRWSFVNSIYNGSQSAVPLGHSDSLLQWEVNKKLELSLNLGFWDERLNLEVAWYRNRCNDQLVQFPTPAFTGFSYVTANSPANVQNKGWEFIINSKIIDNKNFKWKTRINIGINQNKLLFFPNLSQSPYAGQYIIGQSLNIIRLLHYSGVNPSTGEYIFEDKNKDGQITYDFSARESDDSYIHNLSPKFDGGFTSDFIYKNWSLSLFFYFKKQIGHNAIASVQIPGLIGNEPIEVMERWQKSGDIAPIARFTTNPIESDYNYQSLSDGSVTDASFIRLQNLSLSYALPEDLVKKYGINNCKLYFRGENLFVYSKYKGTDPEVQNFYIIPKSMVLTAGFSITF